MTWKSFQEPFGRLACVLEVAKDLRDKRFETFCVEMDVIVKIYRGSGLLSSRIACHPANHSQKLTFKPALPLAPGG
jgi:hypothetical protein